MKCRDPYKHNWVHRWTYTLALLVGLFVHPPTALTADCGLSLQMYTDQANPGPEYPLGTPVKMMLVIKNETGFTLNTTRGFGQGDFYKGLILTTPSGERRQFVDEGIAFDAPPPLFIDYLESNTLQTKNLICVPAETLSEDWVRTITIEDLRELFPIMRDTPGWYTIEVQQPLVRYLWTLEYGNAGLLGVDNEDDVCRETLKSNQIQVYIAPPSGAQLQVRIIDGGSQPPTLLGQVPVKIFDGNIAVQDFNQAWSGREPILEGTTDFEGLAVWGAGVYCRPEPEQRYTAIALYGGDYRSVPFESGTAAGWGAGCGNVIDREILFGMTRLPGLQEFSLIASNSIWVKANAAVEGGHVGVLDASLGLWLDSGVEISIGPGAKVADGLRIYGDSVKLWPKASVGDVYHNDLQNDGEIRGEAVTPLYLPLEVEMPPLPPIKPGKKNYRVPAFRAKTLKPGGYRDVTVGLRGTLKLKEGVYHFRNLNLGYKSQLFCLGPGPTEVRIKKRLYPGYKAKIGPLPTTNLTAKELLFFVKGTNGNLFDLFAYPRAAEIGLLNQVRANIVAPNGTIAIDAGSDVQGSFIAQGVVVGVGSVVHLESGF